MHIVVIGADETGLGPSLRGVVPRAQHSAIREALRHPGTLAGADLALFAWAPGANPTLEEQAFAAGTGMLHVAIQPGSATIGPYVAWALTPCPRCHARLSGIQAKPSPADPLLHRWAVSWLALEVDALTHHGVTDLVLRSYRWEAERPGLQEMSWSRHDDCQHPGCVSAA